MATPYSVTVHEHVGSTQDLARSSLASDGGPVVVIAHRQDAGRGRSGSSWETAPRAVAVSVAMTEDAISFDPSVVSLVAGVAARRVLGTTVGLKWPNDVMMGDRKLGGILVEAGDAVVVVGLGLNLHWPTPPEGVAALRSEDPGDELGPDLARSWAEELLDIVDHSEWPRAEYAASCLTLGRDVVWEPDGEGRAIDVAPDGSLVVVDRAGVEHRLRSGTIRHLRPR